MKLTEAVKTCFKKYAVFSGRARRSEYWKFWLFNMLVSIVIMVVAAFFSDTPQEAGQGFFAVYGLYGLYTLAALLPSLAATVRRLHDIGRSGGYIFLALIPAAGAIILLIWLIHDSDPNENQYGPNPKLTEELSKIPEKKSSASMKSTPETGAEGYWTCPKCGEKVRESAAYCTNCGEPRKPTGTSFTSFSTSFSGKSSEPAKPVERAKPDPDLWETPSDF